MSEGLRYQPVCNFGNVYFYAVHQVLIDLSKILCEGLKSDQLLHTKKRINVFVGVHQFKKSRLPACDSIKIGIQTEQFIDESGVPLWGINTFKSVLKVMLEFDLILDLSHANLLFYQNLPKLLWVKKIIFGPYIFSKNSSPNIKKTNKLIFLGALNKYRINRLNMLRDADLEIECLSDISGKRVFSIFSGYAGVLNIHFQSGKYTEWPRFLMAHNQGLAFISDELSSQLVPYKHYLPIKDFLDGKNENFDFEFLSQNIKIDFVENYSLAKFLESISNRPISGKNSCILKFFIRITSGFLFKYLKSKYVLIGKHD